MGARALERLQLETSLRQALARQEFSLYYQPLLEMPSGRVVALEALLRWRHPERGLMIPDQFISLAEDSGLVVPIDHWVLASACRQATAWDEQGLPPVAVSVNLSGRTFADPDLLQAVVTALSESGLDPTRLELEITEGVLMERADRTIQTLQALKAVGVRLAVDDFGTGYSSLAYLKAFPIDILKVDRSFVRDLTRDADDAAIVLAVIALAQSLGLQVVGEGVEDAAQLGFLRERGCDYAQGFLWGEPVAAEQVPDLLRRLSN
jgi:EAL domain-containing protein (putative c-di-GMP-specific phosphodiesterase class I)